MHRIAIAVAVLLVPVAAYTAAGSERDASTSVVDDANAYMRSEDLAPQLTLVAYEDDAWRLTHSFATGTTLETSVSITAGNPGGRFAVVNPTASLAPGGAHTVRVKDNAFPHTAGTFDVTFRADVTVTKDGARIGAVAVSRAIEVTVI